MRLVPPPTGWLRQPVGWPLRRAKPPVLPLQPCAARHRMMAWQNLLQHHSRRHIHQGKRIRPPVFQHPARRPRRRAGAPLRAPGMPSRAAVWRNPSWGGAAARRSQAARGPSRPPGQVRQLPSPPRRGPGRQRPRTLLRRRETSRKRQLLCMRDPGRRANRQPRTRRWASLGPGSRPIRCRFRKERAGPAAPSAPGRFAP